jgi:hypothetical protein
MRIIQKQCSVVGAYSEYVNIKLLRCIGMALSTKPAAYYKYNKGFS